MWALQTETKRLSVADSLSIPVCWPIRHGRAQPPGENGAVFGRSAKGGSSGFQRHALIHQPTGVVITTMLLPGNRDDRAAASALAMPTGGGLLLGDQGYGGEETFDWLQKNAQMLPGYVIG